LNNAAASLGDIFAPISRNRASIFFAFFAFGGPSLGPIVGGFVQYNVSWRWNLHIVSIFTAVSTIVALIGLKETHGPTILKRRQGINLGDEGVRKFMSSLLIAVTRPLQLLFTEPIDFLSSLYLSVVYGLLYGFFSAFSVAFIGIRKFTVWQYGLTYVSIAVGFLIGSVILYFPHNQLYIRAFTQAQKEGSKVPAEVRLAQAVWAGPLLSISLFLFAWTAPFTHIHWIVPCIAMALFGLGTILIFTGFIPYLIDCYLIFAASAIAAGTFSRAFFACAFPLFTVQMYEKLTVQGATSLFAGISVLLAPLPFLFVKLGPRLRARSAFAFA
jgi:MFS family permease